jgi:hypothetical protein
VSTISHNTPPPTPHQAVWAGYLGDHAAQLDHQLAAGAADAAHATFCAHVAPGLFLEATAASTARLTGLAGRLTAAQVAIGPSWAAGGGLYHAWCRLFVAPDAAAGGGAAWRRDVAAEAVRPGGDTAGLLEAAGALAQQLVAAGAGGGGAAAPARRAVLARMSADVGQVLARLGSRAQQAALAGSGGGGSAAAAAAAASAALLQQGCASLGAHQPVLLSGAAASLAVL